MIKTIRKPDMIAGSNVYIKIYMIIAILSLILIFSGCSSSNKVFGFGKDTSNLKTDYHKGTQGIEMKMKETVTEIYAEDSFSIRVELNNLGAYDVTNGKLMLFSYDDKNKILGNNIVQFNLVGKNIENPTGGYDVFDFKIKNFGMPVLGSSTFAADVCYNYATYASIPICINPSSAEVLKSGCKIASVSGSGGQGGPIAVTKADLKVIDRGDRQTKLAIKIYLANQGKGRVRQYDQNCGGNAIIDIKEILFSHYKKSGNDIKCKTKDSQDAKYIILRADEDNTIDCTVDISNSEGSYTTPLSVELEYGYTNTLEKKVIIKENKWKTQ